MRTAQKIVEVAAAQPFAGEAALFAGKQRGDIRYRRGAQHRGGPIDNRAFGVVWHSPGCSRLLDIPSRQSA
jgi:hypothetical protein